MKITPLIRSKRVFRYIKRYEPILEQDKEKCSINYSLQEDEQVLGIYKNDPVNSIANVLFTSKGMHFYSEAKKVVIGYDKIKDMQVPGEKNVADTILIAYENNNGKQQAKLSIKGGEGRCRDVWEILRYLMRVQSDVEHGK